MTANKCKFFNDNASHMKCRKNNDIIIVRRKGSPLVVSNEATHTRGKGSQAPQDPRSDRTPRCTAPPQCTIAYAKPQPPGAPQEGAKEKDISARHKRQRANENDKNVSNVEPANRGKGSQAPQDPRSDRTPRCTAPPQCAKAYAEPQPPGGPQEDAIEKHSTMDVTRTHSEASIDQ